MQEIPRKQGFQPAIVLHSLHSFLHFGMGFLHSFLQQAGRPNAAKPRRSLNSFSGWIARGRGGDRSLESQSLARVALDQVAITDPRTE